MGIEGDIRVLSLPGYLRIEDLGSKPKIAADGAILDPRFLFSHPLVDPNAANGVKFSVDEGEALECGES